MTQSQERNGHGTTEAASTLGSSWAYFSERPSDGGGYVAYKKADYAHALSRSDTDVQMYLFETFGGWCNAVKRLFYQMKDKVRNKLSKRQHDDEASWSTRSWLSLQAQRMSVALQLAAAEEIATELRLAAASEDAAVA